MTDLGPLVGEWTLELVWPDGSLPDVRGRVTFEPLGETFLVEKWQVALPEAPDGIAILDGERQHCFDERGVHRVYEMTLEGGVWTLRRDHPGFDQRFTGAPRTSTTRGYEPPSRTFVVRLASCAMTRDSWAPCQASGDLPSSSTTRSAPSMTRA